MLKLKLRRINKKISIVSKKLPRFLAEKAFFTSLVFIFFASILGGLVFYKYSFLVEKRKPEALAPSLSLNEKVFQEILKIWQEREKEFKESELKTYPNPFKLTK